MNHVKVLHEYQPGEYCKAIQCPHYNDGDFDDKCDKCKAFIYYQWLRDNEYKLLIVENNIIKDKATKN